MKIWAKDGVHPSMHSSILFLLSKIGWRWQQAKQGIPDVPLPSNTSQHFLGDPEAFPGKMRYITRSTNSGSTLTVPSKPPKGGAQGASSLGAPETARLASLDKGAVPPSRYSSSTS